MPKDNDNSNDLRKRMQETKKAKYPTGLPLSKGTIRSGNRRGRHQMVQTLKTNTNNRRGSNPAQELKNAAKKRLVSSLTAGHRANAGKKRPQPKDQNTGSRLRGRQDSLNDAMDMLNKQNRGK